ncbi:MAG TPA: metabolite traffic protein EboE, partial [Polyangiaceae bacterium]
MRTAGAHLTYCTNIHPGESYAEVRDNLANYVRAVRERVAPGRPFGVGLRLSARAASELSAPAVLEELKDFLRSNELYVFTLNGFPYGPFHGQPVKDGVYRPDWTAPERLGYTDELARLLAELLPDGMAGSVSTVPLGFKGHLTSEGDVSVAVDQLLRHVAVLHRLRQDRGREVALCLEPEPCCVLETIEETTSFFEGELFSRSAREKLAG